MKSLPISHQSKRALVLIGLTMSMLLSSAQTQAQEWIYVVAPGDNLWNLSEKYLDKVTRFEQLRKLNNIENPKKMRPGTQVRVPLKWIKDNPVPATVLSINGTAEITTSRSSSTTPLAVGDNVYLGDQIRALSETTIAIQFADGSILTLHENSRVSFDHLSAHGTTGMVDSRVRLIEGRIDTKVIPSQGPGSRFEIHTPSAISAVRGTVYRASVNEQGNSSNIEVLEGKVAVSGSHKKRLINAGYGTLVAVGETPLPAQKLLPEPVIDALPTRIRQINWRLSWKPIQGAENYRVEVSEKASFDTLIWQQITDYNRSAIPDIADGTYHVRVRGIDKLGLEGLNTTVQLILDARPQPPLALSPTDKQVLRAQAPLLKWTESEEANAYQLEIAKDSSFEEIILSKSHLTTAQFETTNAETGTYYWRLTSVAADGEIGPTGPARTFEIKPIPEKVSAELTATESGNMIASWQPSGPDQRYQVQIAADQKFNRISQDSIIDEAQIEIEPTTHKSRYLRVKAIEPDGYEGPWGATQKIPPPPSNAHWYFLGAVLGLFGIPLL